MWCKKVIGGDVVLEGVLVTALWRASSRWFKVPAYLYPITKRID